MEVKEFEEFIGRKRKMFGEIMQNKKTKMTDVLLFLKICHDQCTSDYEEQTLIENLQEVVDGILCEGVGA